MDPNTQISQQLKEHFEQLPQVVRDAVLASNVEQSLRSLADSHKLHYDQWQVFENEVMLAILGLQKVEDLEQNIIAHMKVPSDVAHALAEDVNIVVFEPIREKLEEGLQDPGAAHEGEEGSHPPTPAAPAVQPATPPAPAPDIKVARPSGDSAYQPGQASHERKNIADDPYREAIG